MDGHNLLQSCEDTSNKAGYTAQDAPSTRLKITGDGRSDGQTDELTDGRTDATSYRDATAHLKMTTSQSAPRGGQKVGRREERGKGLQISTLQNQEGVLLRQKGGEKG